MIRRHEPARDRAEIPTWLCVSCWRAGAPCQPGLCSWVWAVHGPWQGPPCGGSHRVSLQGLRQHAPLSGDAEKWAGSGQGSPEQSTLFNRAESNRVASYNPRVTCGRASASTAPVACQSWPSGSSGHGQPVPSSRQSPAGAGAGHGVLPALVVHLGPCPSHAPRSAGLSGDVVAAPCSPASTARAALGREASVKGGTWLLWCWRGSSGQQELGGGSRAEISSVTQVGQGFCRNISLNASPFLLLVGICGEQPCGTWPQPTCRSAAPVTRRHPAGARLAFRRP